MKEFNCSVYRGGTSKALCFLRSELPSENLDQFLCEVMGGEGKQIDGLGGANSLTSKVAIIAKGSDCIEYTFAQVAIDKNIVDYKSNCGNISSAVGPFAYNSGMVDESCIIADESSADALCIRIFNTNTKKYIKSKFKVKNGRFDPAGDFSISGVPGTASKIEISFVDPAGSLGGKLLPTGLSSQIIQTSFGELEISIVDAGAPLVFMKASDVLSNGLYEPISPTELDKIEEVRGIASELLGLASRNEAKFKNPAIPKAALVSSSNDKANVHIRMMSMQKPHQAIAVTGTVCIGMASKINGTLIEQHLSAFDGQNLCIKHPSGYIDCIVGENEVKINRTARLLMSGKIYSKSDF